MLKLRLIALAVFVIGCQSRDQSMQIVFGGDVMLDRGIRTIINREGIAYLFDDIESVFRESDFAVVNFESAATDRSSPLTKKYVFRAEPEWLPALKKSGITHCILANNHSYDHGREALSTTAANLIAAHISPVGYGPDQSSACAPTILAKGKLRVAIFSSVTVPLESWMYLANAPGMCQASIEDLVHAITEYKSGHPDDYVIATLHWGVEYQTIPTAMQRHQAKQLVSAGADAIIGHHPHVVQHYEKIDDKPVFYSIGNLVFDNQNPATHEGILVKFQAGQSGISTEIIPYRSERFKPIIKANSRLAF